MEIRAVSKNTLDWAVYANKGIIWQIQSENPPAAIRAVIKQLQALPDFDRSNSVVCMEHTATADRGSLQRTRLGSVFLGSVTDLSGSFSTY